MYFKVMEKVRLLFFLGIALLSGGQSLFSQDKVEQKTKAKIESRHYIINVDRALPMQGRSVNLTSSYSLEIRNDSVISYLPYFGRAYTVPYGGGNGMIFREPLTDYTISFDKKNAARIKFRTKTTEGTADFNLQIFPNGSSSIQVTPSNRQSISYQGTLSEE